MNINVKSDSMVTIEIGDWIISIDNSTNDQIISKYKMPGFSDWHDCTWVKSKESKN